ncbi:MAG: peptidylprolyl isomerase [Magnetococcales bacterium]|nr:peptidylprolyl isomerase [Magnetococcales bacterium]
MSKKLAGSLFWGSGTPAVLVAVVLLLLGVVGATHAASPQPPPPFARVGEVVIDAQTFFDAVRVEIRQRFYHGSIPENQRASFLREVGDSLVDHVLLVQEAQRRHIKPDQAMVDESVKGYNDKHEQDPEWIKNRETLLPLMVRQLQEKSLVKQLESSVRTVPGIDLEKLRAYHAARAEKFTEPAKQEVSVILVAVDPSAGGEAWKEAHAKAGELVKQLRAGADFSDMARLHSGHASANRGGKVDYSHKGMLSPDVEKALDAIPVGAVTDPIMVLEGVAVFRLDGRTPARVVPFQDAQSRVRSLLTREMADQAWDTLKKRLREQASVSVHEEYYLPSPPPGAAPVHPPAGGNGSPEVRSP